MNKVEVNMETGEVAVVPLTPEDIAAFASMPPDPPERLSVSARQLRLALLEQNFLDDVEALINNPSTPKSVKIEWEYANEFDMDNPLISAFATALQRSPEDVSNLFALAKTK
jgi:hypothetical protein